MGGGTWWDFRKMWHLKVKKSTEGYETETSKKKLNLAGPNN